MAGVLSNALAAPAPTFFDGDRLADVHAPQSANLVSDAAAPVARLRLPVRLLPSSGPAPLAAALLLTPRELGWLRTLVYRLPDEFFAACSLWQGPDLAVLLGGSRGTAGVPFGTPLRRVGDTRLFLPLSRRLVPELPWAVLAEALRLPEDCLTILTDDRRLDLPQSGFAPLTRALVAPPEAVCPPLRTRRERLPELKWSAEPRPPVEVIQTGTAPVRPAPSSPQPIPQEGKGAAAPTDLGRLIVEQAKASEAAKDYLAAALYFGLARDVRNQARCFRLAATDGAAE
jgi:hypothetical protein